MSRKKKDKFKLLPSFPNVFIGKEKADSLRELIREKPVVLELGCGRGECTIALAEKHPEKIFIGIDYQGERLFLGADESREKKLTNAFFLQTKAEDLMAYFSPGSIHEIIIPFPDPYPRQKHEKRRLTASGFLEIYRAILRIGGRLDLKTDNQVFLKYSISTIEKSGGKIIEVMYSVPEDSTHEIASIRTFYGESFRKEGNVLSYLSATLM